MQTKIYEEIVENATFSISMLKAAFIKLAKSNNEVSLLHSDHLILKLLMENKSMTMSEIGRLFGISKPHLTVIVDHLVGKNFIKRNYNKEDRRVINIEITEKGIESFNKTKYIIREEFKKILSCLDDTDVQILSDSLKNLKKVISKINLNKK
jgi:DNA-binding MarR family transcriptional regulator